MKIFKLLRNEDPLTKRLGPIPLYVGIRNPPTAGSFDIRPRSLDDWIAKLPLAHLGQTVRLLFTTLIELNGLDFPAAERFRVLEQLYPILIQLDHKIAQRYTGALPLSEKNSSIASMEKTFLENIAIAYKIIVTDRLARGDQGIRMVNFVTAVHRSVWSLAQVLVGSCRTYGLPITSLWQEIHWLYQFSESHDLHQQKVIPCRNLPGFSQPQIPDTISGVYKQVLLFAIANPHSLHHTEIRRLYDAAGEWQGQCTLWRSDKLTDHLSDNFEVEKGGCFLVDLDSDSGPSAFSMDRYQHMETDNSLLFDINPLNTVLDNHSRTQESKSTLSLYNDIAINTMRRLILSCGTVNLRRFPRQSKSGNIYIEMVMGLTAIHDTLIGAQDLPGIE